jgi:VanZ family protein
MYSSMFTIDVLNSVFEPQRRRAYRIAALMWAAALFIVSLQPKRPSNFHFSLTHHIAHLFGFGALAFLATVGFSRTGRMSVWPAAASFLLGLAIEFLQHLQNQKPVEWQDVRDDAIGVLVVAAISHLVYRWRTEQTLL